MNENTHYLTNEGREKLEAELRYLKTTRRQEVAGDLKEAIEAGDLSENAAYDQAKVDQAFVEGRIREITAILTNAQVLVADGGKDKVSLGSTVTIVEDGEPEEVYKIVGRAEADPLHGQISNESPIGKALMGHRTGDEVNVISPGGKIVLRIVSIA